MKLLNYKLGNQIRLGIKSEQGILDVKQAADAFSLALPITMEEVIQSGEKGLAQLKSLLQAGAQTIPEESLLYAPCVLGPGKILCIGVNYTSHSREVNESVPDYPILFSKFSNALAAHNQVIQLPPSAKKFDYEAELVIVMGKEASKVSKEKALSYVFGYTVGNDLSARDLQFRSSQWLLGKSCDCFAPIGPYIVTADEIDPDNLDIACSVNGETRQSSNTRHMIFDCASIISYASQYITLKPGDIIFTGTPSGVILGHPEAEQNWLKAGDETRITIENIGTLTNVLK